MKGKWEKKRHTNLNAEFLRISRKDKKDLLSDQGKEIDRNKRMRNTRDLFKNIIHTKGIFYAKMDRNGMGPTEAEDIKKRW